MGTTYRVILAVNSTALAMVLGLIEGAADVRLTSVTDFSDVTPLPPSPPAPTVRATPIPVTHTMPASESKPSRYAGGKKNKGISSKALVVETLRSGRADLDEIKRVFVNRGFSAASASPVISGMLRAGNIERGMHGRLQLPSRTTNGGA